MKKLRDYQEKAIINSRISFSKGFSRILIYLATGGGKSVIFGQLISNLFKKDKKIVFVIKRRQLIFQARNHLESWGIHCGIIMGSEKMDITAPVQICSIDTVNARAKKGEIDFLKDFDFVVVDECHDTTADNYRSFFCFLEGIPYDKSEFLYDLDKYFKKTYFGLTATPFEVGNKVQDFWQEVVKPIEVHELRDRGFLTNAKVMMSHTVDTSSLKKTFSGDYKTADAFDLMKDKRIVGNVVDEYKKHGNNKAAILFAVNIEHSKLMAGAFNDAGIPAIHCDQATKQKDRDEAIRKLQDGEIRVLCNVNIFSTGVDIPQAEVGIMARPTASEILYIQQLGRLLRPFKICKKCGTERGAEANCNVCETEETSYTKGLATILDHGENTMRFGLPFEIRDAVISKDQLTDKKAKLPKESEGVKIIRSKQCKSCMAELTINESICPYCGSPVEVTKRDLKEVDGTLVEVTEDGYKKLKIDNIKKTLKELKFIQIDRGFKKYWIYFQVVKKHKRDLDLMCFIPEIPKWVVKKAQAGEIK